EHEAPGAVGVLRQPRLGAELAEQCRLLVPSRPPASGTFRSPGSPGTSRRHCSADRKSTRLNSSHVSSSYAVFCLKKKKLGSGRHHGFQFSDGPDAAHEIGRLIWSLVMPGLPAFAKASAD